VYIVSAEKLSAAGDCAKAVGTGAAEGRFGFERSRLAIDPVISKNSIRGLEKPN
jgi:hypothetical protein